MAVSEITHNFTVREKNLTGQDWRNKTAWDYITERDKLIFGEKITTKEEQTRLALGFFIPGILPYLWDSAEDFREIIYSGLHLKKGNKVLVIGECLEACGFLDEVKKRLDGEGEIQAFDLMYGSLPAGETFPEFKYTIWLKDFPAEYFDVVFFPQGVHHEENWNDRAKEVAKVLKKGGRAVFAEAGWISPYWEPAVQADSHIETVMKKVLETMFASFETGGVNEPGGGLTTKAMKVSRKWPTFGTQTTPEQLKKAFAPYLKDIGGIVWRGILLVEGTKK